MKNAENGQTPFGTPYEAGTFLDKIYPYLHYLSFFVWATFQGPFLYYQWKVVQWRTRSSVWIATNAELLQIVGYKIGRINGSTLPW